MAKVQPDACRALRSIENSLPRALRTLHKRKKTHPKMCPFSCRSYRARFSAETPRAGSPATGRASWTALSSPVDTSQTKKDTPKGVPFLLPQLQGSLFCGNATRRKPCHRQGFLDGAFEPCGHFTNEKKTHPKVCLFSFGGSYRARTCDPLLVRQMLSQLS